MKKYLFCKNIPQQVFNHALTRKEIEDLYTFKSDYLIVKKTLTTFKVIDSYNGHLEGKFLSESRLEFLGETDCRTLKEAFNKDYPEYLI